MDEYGTPVSFTLTAESEQTGDVPSGVWRGELPEAGLELQVTFEPGEDDGLAATLSILSQGLTEAPLSDVRYMEERAIGDVVNEHVFAPGDVGNQFTADYAWGDHLLRVAVSVDVNTEQVIGLQVLPAVPTPQPETVPTSDTAWQLPFSGTWWVFWGGVDALYNYHVSVPSQHFAYDFVIWRDGTTWQGEGAGNADYFVWGEDVLAPAAGDVVVAVNGDVDHPPHAEVTQEQVDNPGGNHVVIQTAEDEFVVLAHMQQGSVQVEVGDQVEAGDLLGVVGNSGLSSEPHLHLHAQDTPEVLDPEANGIPIVFDHILLDGEPTDDVSPVQGSLVAPAD